MSGANVETDLLVVGGGPAGLAVAIRARQRGLAVRVIDRARPPIDKACGEGLMPDGVQRLRELGVEVPDERRAVVRGIRYLDGELEAEARFAGEGGWGIRRLVLQESMARRAADLGAKLLWGVEAQDFAPDGVVTGNGAMRARWVVAADGLHSRLRHLSGLAGAAPIGRRYGIARHFAIPPWSDCVEVYWGEQCEGYVTPVGPREVGVAMLWGGAAATFDDLLEEFPALADRLAGASQTSRERGAGPLEQRTSAFARGWLALVGDASGYVDAITGEGLSIAFHQAFAVVDAIERGDLELYDAAARRIVALPNLVSRLLLFVERRPELRSRLVAALAADPVLFSRLLAVHARQAPLSQFGAGGLARLAWRLLTVGSWP